MALRTLAADVAGAARGDGAAVVAGAGVAAGNGVHRRSPMPRSRLACRSDHGMRPTACERQPHHHGVFAPPAAG